MRIFFARADQPFYRIEQRKQCNDHGDQDDEIVPAAFRSCSVSDTTEDAGLCRFAGRTKKKIDHFFSVEFALIESISLSMLASSTFFPVLPQLDRSWLMIAAISSA